MKFCNGPCATKKSFDLFHKGNGAFGLKSRCIECCKLTYKPNSKEYRRSYYLKNTDRAREARRRHQRKNREQYRIKNSEYDRLHRPERAAREAFRRAQKLKATPPWLNDEHKKLIEIIYKQRYELSLEKGIIYHVDHIIPLISKNVCGLHVPWNLQIISAVENLQKGNRV